MVGQAAGGSFYRVQALKGRRVEGRANVQLAFALREGEAYVKYVGLTKAWARYIIARRANDSTEGTP